MELTPSEKDLLLCAARSAVGRVDMRLTNAVLACRLDLDRVMRAAAQHGMLPLLGRHLREPGAAPLPPEADAQLGALLEEDRRRILTLCAELAEVLQILGRAGIPAVTHKGPVLAADLYGDACLRSPADLDVLIRFRDLSRAVEVLGREGFSPQPRLSPAVLSILPHSECDLLLSRARPLLFLELHWDVVPPCFGVSLDVEGVIRRAGEVLVGPDAVPTLSAEDLLVCLCINGAKDGWSRLEAVTAISALCRRSLDWEAVVSRSRLWRAERMLLLGVGIARELLEAELPALILQALGPDRTLRRLTRRSCLRMFELRNPEAGAPTMFRLHALDGTRARVRYLAHRATVPTYADVEWLRHRRLPLWLYGLVRPFRLAIEAFRGPAAGRVAGNPVP